MASHLYCICQAIDLRVLEQRFDQRILQDLTPLVHQHFAHLIPSSALTPLTQTIVNEFCSRYLQTCSLDSIVRIPDGLDTATPPIIRAFDQAKASLEPGVIQSFLDDANLVIGNALRETRESMFESQPGTWAAPYLGKTRGLYKFVRVTLGIKTRQGDVAEGRQGPTVGSQVSKIVKAMRLRSGLGEVLLKSFE